MHVVVRRDVKHFLVSKFKLCFAKKRAFLVLSQMCINYIFSFAKRCETLNIRVQIVSCKQTRSQGDIWFLEWLYVVSNHVSIWHLSFTSSGPALTKMERISLNQKKRNKTRLSLVETRTTTNGQEFGIYPSSIQQKTTLAYRRSFLYIGSKSVLGVGLTLVGISPLSTKAPCTSRRIS